MPSQPTSKSSSKVPAAKAAAAKVPATANKKTSKLESIKNFIGLGAGKKAAAAAKPAKAAKPVATKGAAPAAHKPAAKGANGKGTTSAAAAAATPTKGAKPAPTAPARQKTGAPPTSLLKAKSTRSRESDEAVCREVACENLATSGGYCRMHYIRNWKKIKRKEVILGEKKLNQYIEELVAKYPEKYIEAIRQDLASDKDFAKVIYDLDLDETADDIDVENESIDSEIGHIKGGRDFEDEGESF